MDTECPRNLGFVHNWCLTNFPSFHSHLEAVLRYSTTSPCVQEAKEGQEIFKFTMTRSEDGYRNNKVFAKFVERYPCTLHKDKEPCSKLQKRHRTDMAPGSLLKFALPSSFHSSKVSTSPDCACSSRPFAIESRPPHPAAGADSHSLGIQDKLLWFPKPE